jgi:nitrite reductase/ring-hydroxylating ferredoxin subunit
MNLQLLNVTASTQISRTVVNNSILVCNKHNHLINLQPLNVTCLLHSDPRSCWSSITSMLVCNKHNQRINLQLLNVTVSSTQIPHTVVINQSILVCHKHNQLIKLHLISIFSMSQSPPLRSPAQLLINQS